MFAAAAPDALDKADHKLKLQGVSSTTERPKPQQLMKQFQKASQQGNKENLVANMEEKMSAVQAHCWAGSNGSVRSGLKSFCTFAFEFPGVQPRRNFTTKMCQRCVSLVVLLLHLQWHSGELCFLFESRLHQRWLRQDGVG